MTDMPMGDHTREIVELHIGAAFSSGAKLEEVVEAVRAALIRIFGEAADQFQALNDAMNALARGEELEPLTPDVAERHHAPTRARHPGSSGRRKAPGRPTPPTCNGSGHKHDPPSDSAGTGAGSEKYELHRNFCL